MARTLELLNQPWTNSSIEALPVVSHPFKRRKRLSIRRKGDHSFRPKCMALEDRTLLSTIMWNTATAPTGGDWDTASNWVGDAVPTASDDAVIDLTSSGTVTHSTSADDSVLSLTINGFVALNLESGSISLGDGQSGFYGLVTISAGASLNLDAGASVSGVYYAPLTDDGALNIGSGALVGNDAMNILVNGTMDATNATFPDVIEQVNSGGELTATGCTFAGDEVTLESGSVLTSTDLTGNTFNDTLSVPFQDIPLLDNNLSCRSIDVVGSSLSSGQSLSLNLIGNETGDTTYNFGNFTVQVGATLSVAPDVSVQIGQNQTVTVDGTLDIGSGASVAGDWLQINSGGELTATGCTFTFPNGAVTLESGSILTSTDLTGNTFNGALDVQYQDLPMLADNLAFESIGILGDELGSGQTLALNLIGTASTENLIYTFASEFTVSAGATMSVAPDVTISGSITDDGALNMGSGVNFLGQIVVNGTMDATDATLGSIQVNVGGELTATSCALTGGQLTLESGSILTSTDLTGNSFGEISVPYQDIPLLTDNPSFGVVDISSGELDSGQTFSLNLIGAESTQDLSYGFSGDFTVEPGATLSVAPDVRVWNSGNPWTIIDDGLLNVGSGALFEFLYPGQILVNGTMEATGATFADEESGYGGTSEIAIGSSGDLRASGCTFTSCQVTLESGSTLTLSGFTGNIFNTELNFQESHPSISGTGTLILGSSNLTTNALYAQGNNGNQPSTLTIGSDVTIEGGSGTIGGYYSGDSVIFDGSLIATTPGEVVTLEGAGSAGTEQSYTALTATNGGTINLPESLQINGSSIVTVSAGSYLEVTGNLLGNTQNPALYEPKGTLTLDGTGTVAAPQLLEAMSADLGSGPTGFTDNFAYGSLVVGNTNYVELVNQSVNSPGSFAEAVYANSLIVPAGSTLNLNGINLYVRDAEIGGTITGGSITQISNSGPLLIDSPTPGHFLNGGELDDWTFFGRGADVITVALDTGSGVAGGPIAPQLGWAEVQLLGASGNVLASAISTSSGQILTLNNVSLPADGTYTIAVEEASGHVSSTGNYVLAAYDVTPNVQSLNVNQTTTSTVSTPYSTDVWTFSAAANTQVYFDLLAASASGLNFSLTGPNNFSGFSNIAGSSALVILPTAGTYTLNAQGTGGAIGDFSFQMVQTTETPLALNTPFQGAFAGSGQPQLFVANLPSTSPMVLKLDDESSADHVELYASRNVAPTRETFDYGANGAGSSQSILIPSADAGTWYILVYAEFVSSPPSNFTLLANATPVSVTAVTPATYGANAVATLTLTGAGFTSDSSVMLVSSSGTMTYPASIVAFDTFTQLTASVNLAGVPQGTYSIQVSNGNGGSDTLPSAFTVTAAGQADFQTQLILPSAIGRHISSTFYVEYSNTGTAAMPAPLLLLESSVADDVPLFTLNSSLVVSGYWTSATPQGYSNTVEILASGKVPGMLEPGESVTVPVYYAGMEQPWNMSESQFQFDIRVFNTTDKDDVDWGPLQSSMQPAGVSNTAWSTIYSSLISQMVSLGPNPSVVLSPLTLEVVPPLYSPQFVADYMAGLVGTWGGYVQLLDNEAAYLGQLGEDVTDVNSLWGFAVQQADNALSPLGPYLASATDDSLATPGTLSLSFSRVFATSIDGRDATGPLGLGWSTPWQTTVSVASDGTVTITGADGAERVFEPDSRTSGAYFSEPGDTGTLTADGNGGYLLTEADGTETDYNANGTLNYMQDTNGNRITAGYTGGRLTSLTASSGQWIDIAYNAPGLISTVTDSDGRTTTYTYDESNQHLISVTGYTGQTTTYAYGTTSGSAALNALASITFPGGTHQYFTYDSEGRVSGTSNDGGAQSQTFAYALGQVNVTDGTGDTSSLYYNEQGLVVKSVDALGNVTLNTYDSNFNLVRVTNSLGESETYTYNTAGEVTSSTDFLGNTTYFSYSGPFNDISSMTDANGNTTTYDYSSAGDLLSTTYADGTSDSSTYDPEGDATSFLNANGQPIDYTYNSAGQILTETFSDGSQYKYTYDANGNMLTATNATGTTTFTYDATTELLAEVAYPGGLFLEFTYNGAGQRTSMVDRTGFTTDYVYDAVGRLSQLTDGSGNVIVTYTYDADGRLSKKVNGNGTYTTYQYDANGNVLDLINYAPGGSINSEFTYTYNALGLETTEAALDGTWTYTYDADGQLIQAVFASTNSSVPSQDLAYTYDAMGNRITTVINGVSTQYVTNDMNEYTSVGGVAHTYDADGNLLSDGTNTYAYNALNQLTSVTGPGGTTTYTYNALEEQVASTANGQATKYLIDPSGLGNVVRQYNSAGTQIATYTYGIGLVNRSDATGTIAYYDFDATGNTSDLTGPTGSPIALYGYAPFGLSILSQGTIANPFQFIGQTGVIQETAGLDSTRSRFLDSTTGRFDSQDPAQLAGGSANYYTYANNNPIQLIDPSGQSFMSFSQNFLQGFKGALNIVKGTIELAGAIGLVESTGGFGGFAAFDIAYAGWKDVIDGAWDLSQAMQAAAPAPQRDPNAYDPSDPFGAAKEPGPAQLPAPPFDSNGAGSLEDPSPTPIPPNGAIGDSCINDDADSEDPNSLLGPAGFGSPNFVPDNGTELPYEIDFENSPSATAPAQAVTVTDQLDPNLNWTTFQLTGIGWGDTNLTIPVGSQYYETTVPMTYDGQTFDVLIEAGIHTNTGEVYATFQSLDPVTQLPPSVLVGLLPPENGTGRGMGYISFMIQPNANLPTDTEIRNVALITFDQNPAIATDQADDADPSKGIDTSKQALVTIDSGAPTSCVAALPSTESTANFTVTWSGQDDTGGSGVGSYDIYVSNNGGPYTTWQSDTTQTAATFDGIDGDTYAFYSVAADNVGNVQPTPTAAQATTTIDAAFLGSTTSIQVSEDPATLGDTVTFTATVTPQDTSNGTPTGTIQFQIDGTDAGAPFTLTNGSVTVTQSALALGHHSITAIYTSNNGLFDTSTGALTGGESVMANVNISVASAAPESTYGHGVTFTGTVSPTSSGLPAPSGAVQFEVNGTAFGGPVTVVDGQAVSPSIATLPAGTDSITAVFSNDPNYFSNSGSTVLTVSPAPLTVTAGPQTMTFGGDVPALTYALTGFVNGDTASVVTGSPSLSTTATPTSGVGSYPITIALGNLLATNYDFPILVDGTFTIDPAPLTVTADLETKVYSTMVPTLGYAIAGFVNGDTAGVVSGVPRISTTATASSNVGDYPITISAGSLSAANYDFSSFVNGTLTVTAPPLVTLTGVQPTTNKKHQVTEIMLTFGGALDTAEADLTSAYRLATPGKKGSYTAKNAGIIKLKSAAYTSGSDQVTLTVKKPFALTKSVELLVYGTGSTALHDADGRLIDGDDDGRPGGNAVTILRPGGVSLAEVLPVQSNARQDIYSSAVDAIPERRDLIEWRQAGRLERPARHFLTTQRLHRWRIEVARSMTRSEHCRRHKNVSQSAVAVGTPHRDGERATAIYTIIEASSPTTSNSGRIRALITCISSYPAKHIDELLPSNVKL